MTTNQKCPFYLLFSAGQVLSWLFSDTDALWLLDHFKMYLFQGPNFPRSLNNHYKKGNRNSEHDLLIRTLETLAFIIFLDVVEWKWVGNSIVYFF